MNRLRLLAAILLIVLGACTRKTSIVVFSTARARGSIQAPDDCFKRGSCGGFPALKNIYDAEPLPKIIVDLGNWSADTPAGRLTKGSAVMEMMNAFPYDAAVPGITDITLQAKDFDRLADSARFPLIASNLYQRSGERYDKMPQYYIKDVNGYRIGFLSVLLANPQKPEKQKNYARFRIEKGSYDANLAINTLKREGAQIIIMLLSIDPSAESDRTYYRKFTKAAGRVNLIITDDPAVRRIFRSNKTWVVPAGAGNKKVERTEIFFNPETGKISAVESGTIDIDPLKYKENQLLHNIAIKYQIEEKKHFARKIGTLRSTLPLENDGIHPMANFAADCIKLWAKTNASLMPFSETAAGFSSTTVRLSDLYNAFPTDSDIVFVKIRGENLIDSLKSLPYGTFTVSGLKLYYSKDKVLEKTESAAGPLKADKIYQVAVPDSMITAENTSLLANAAEFANSRRPTRDVIRWCTASRYTFTPYTERIIQNGRTSK